MPTRPIDAEMIFEATKNLDAYLNGPDFAAFKERARVLRDRLDEATERLNEQIARIEKVLAQKFASRAAAIEFDANLALVFWQVKGRWGLFVLDANGHLMPLRNASRQRRMEAVHLLEDLVCQLTYEDET